MNQDAEQTFVREAKAYLQPLAIADHLARRAFARGEGAGLDAQAALVFLAFAIEAFCNHVGSKLSPDFGTFDRLRVKDKLREAARLICTPLDLGRRPFQTFHDLLKFRDTAAHPRTQEVVQRSRVKWPTPEAPFVLPKEPPTEWVSFCTPEVLTQALTDVRQGLLDLYKASVLSKECRFEQEVWNVKLSRRVGAVVRPTMPPTVP